MCWLSALSIINYLLKCTYFWRHSSHPSLKAKYKYHKTNLYLPAMYSSISQPLSWTWKNADFCVTKQQLWCCLSCYKIKSIFLEFLQYKKIQQIKGWLNPTGFRVVAKKPPQNKNKNKKRTHSCFPARNFYTLAPSS